MEGAPPEGQDSPRSARREVERESGPAGGFPLGTLFGVQMQVDWSLLIIFALVTMSLAMGLLPAWHPGWSPGLVWGVALGAAVLFFVSVLLHELSHALVARGFGIPVRRITLFLFGGVAHMEKEPSSPRAEFLVAIIGPVVSIIIGVLATLGGSALSAHVFTNGGVDPETAFSALGPVPTLLMWLGPINILLGVFNLVPGFPLDGGRVLRSILWALTGDLRRATRWASNGGRFFAWCLMALGVAMALGVYIPVLGRGVVSGLWLLLIGWFLNNAARMSYQQLVVRETLRGVPVRDVMTTGVRAIPPHTTVDSLVNEHLMQGGQRAFPVALDGQAQGLVCLEDVRKVPRDAWAETTVAQIMTPVDRLVTLGPDDEALDALNALARHAFDQIPILEGEEIVGFVRRQNLMTWIGLQQEGEGRALTAPRGGRAG